jgi:hypothetical protein
LKPGYFEIKIPDATGSFGKKWNGGLRDTFGNTSGGVFTPYRGHVGLRQKKKPPFSPNVLDYVEFTFSGQRS